MTRNCLGSEHQGRSGATRLVRLAAVTCLALAAGSSAVWAQSVVVATAGNSCIHDEVQQRVLQSVAQKHDRSGTLSAVGLPVVEVVADPASVSDTVDSALPYTMGPNVTRSKDWGELRISVSTDNFTDTERYCTGVGKNVSNHENRDVSCSEDDILTEKKRDILMNSILPEAVRLHTDRLKVRQVQDTWKVTGMNGKICGLFKVPQEHATKGINNTDFLLYVASVPSPAGVLSWGATCQVFPDGRPAVGVINVPAAKIMSRYDQRVTRTVAHQIAHALGFSDQFFVNSGMKNSSTGVRDKPSPHPVIKGNTTVAKAREHYGCDSLEYLEMDYQYVSGTPASHLKMHNANDELMAPDVGAGYYSALTMAVFEDMGLYKADFSKAEVMPWGHKAGCDFLEKKCMENDKTRWPQMFCNGSEMLRCTSSRLGLGRCEPSFTLYDSESDSSHFTNLHINSYLSLMNSCPYVVPERNGACDQNSSTAPEDLSAFNVFSDAARCIDGELIPKNRSTEPGPVSGTCANVRCDNTTNTYSVQVKGSSAYMTCTPGQNITLHNVSNAFDTGSYITCPPYVEVCQGNVKAVVDFKADLEKNRGTSSSGERDTHTNSMPSSGEGDTHTNSMPSSGRSNNPTDSMPSSGRGHNPTDSIPNSGRGHTPTDSMPSSGSGANQPDATASNGKGDRLFPLGNSAAGLHSARTLVSAGVALLVVTLTVGLSV